MNDPSVSFASKGPRTSRCALVREERWTDGNRSRHPRPVSRKSKVDVIRSRGAEESPDPQRHMALTRATSEMKHEASGQSRASTLTPVENPAVRPPQAEEKSARSKCDSGLPKMAWGESLLPDARLQSVPSKIAVGIITE